MEFAPIVGSLIAGALCGLIPLNIGKKYYNESLGITGFWSCIISGFILGIILALPVAAIFAIIIINKEKSY